MRRFGVRTDCGSIRLRGIGIHTVGTGKFSRRFGVTTGCGSVAHSGRVPACCSGDPA
ncbi:hypothetical protein [Lonepinella sp. BR2271]|uniref:hypothetical protein n=1 Tax=Lonepinella sp. BR2271 TaxID=3434550 RepID=UPI003F6DB2DE